MKNVRTFLGANIRGTIVCGDALDFLKGLKKDSASLVFLDPPFNLGKPYSSEKRNLDRRPERDYQAWIENVLIEASRIIKPGGSLYLYHIPKWALRFGFFLDGRLEFRHWIAISMKNGFARGMRLYPAHYALLWFTKGDPANFKRPKIAPKKCRHCDKYVKDYGGYRSIIEEKGINLSDFWEDLSPVRHADKKHRKLNELPSVLFNRVMEMSGSPNELYVDPFGGSGSGVVAAAGAGMKFACCDLVLTNCNIVARRLNALVGSED